MLLLVDRTRESFFLLLRVEQGTAREFFLGCVQCIKIANLLKCF